MTTAADRAAAFVQWLEQHGDDRGLMAELRRGLNPDTEFYAWKHLARWCDITNVPQRLAHGLVAGAYASHPGTTQVGNLGDTARLVATQGTEKEDDREKALKTYEGRFRRLLACDSVAEVVECVRGLVRAAKQRQVPINYVQLLLDLGAFGWPEGRERAKVNWASAFWRPPGATVGRTGQASGEPA